MPSRVEDFTAAWKEAESQILSFLNEVDSGPATPEPSLAPLMEDLEGTFDFSHSLSEEEAVRKASLVLRKWSTHTPHRRYFGLFNPDVIPISVVADALVAAFNPQLATVHHAPGAIAMEAHVLSVFQKLLGHDLVSSAANFTTGGLEANHSAVLCALTRALPRFAEVGVGGRKPVFYVSAEAHHSFVKIAHAVGIGRHAAREVEVGTNLKMSMAALAELITSDRNSGFEPFLVVGTAGTTAAGVIDPLPLLAELCGREGLWFHVDAAWGGAALLSEKLGAHLAGIQSADSVTLDAHKWLSVPMGAGMFLCRDRKAVEQTFNVSTSYMPVHGGLADPFSTTLQWSRRFIGLKLFLSLAHLGIDGYARLIEHQAAMGDLLRRELNGKGWLVLNDTPFPLVNFTHPVIEEDVVRPSDVLAALNSRRSVWVSDVRLSTGQHAFRACVTNYRTDESDIRFLVSELDECLRIASEG